MNPSVCRHSLALLGHPRGLFTPAILMKGSICLLLFSDAEGKPLASCCVTRAQKDTGLQLKLTMEVHTVLSLETLSLKVSGQQQEAVAPKG
jgi:hypothetical protein